MADVALRKELHALVDAMPEAALLAVKPLLAYLVEDYWKPVIEPASPEEIAMIEEGMREYEQDPSSFVPWEAVKKELGRS